MRNFNGFFMTLIFLVMGLILGACQSLGMPHDDSQGRTIFEIGTEDNSDAEFRSTGFGEIQEYACQVGVDCSTGEFLQRLNRSPLVYADAGVQSVAITFDLRTDYGRVVLRLVRGGDETTVVELDETQPYFVTNSMLGSNDGYLVGAYDLDLGSLRKGKHIIKLTVADDGKGNGTYQWDAIRLFAR